MDQTPLMSAVKKHCDQILKLRNLVLLNAKETETQSSSKSKKKKKIQDMEV